MSDDASRTTETVELRANDTLANERTFLSYVRTALSLIAFGFVIARFSLFTREFAEMTHTTAPTHNLSLYFGAAMAMFGVFIGIMGAWRHAETDRGLRQGVVMTLSRTTGYLISLFVTVVGLIVAYELIAYR